MSKHIPAAELPLKAPAHSGSSEARPPRTPAVPLPEEGLAITDQQIAVRAYEIWLSRGKPEGTDLSDWFEARHQLHDHQSSPQSSTVPVNPTR